MKIERKKEFKEIRIKHNRFLFWLIITLFILLIILIIYILSFNNSNYQVDDNTQSGLANPASVYCMDNNGQIEIRTNQDGSQYGVCSKNGEECEEWAYFKTECEL